MYGPPGFAYVYRIYGMYDCLNVVTEPEGRPAAVLIRAVEPTEGVEAMRQARIARMRRRGPAQAARLETLPEVQLAAGPGLVAAAFDIDLTDSGVDLFHDRSRIHLERGWQPGEIVTTPRVGIGYAAEPWRSHSWRFIDPSSPAVSGPRTRS